MNCYCMWEFHQIYNVGAVGDEGELMRFVGQRSRSRRDKCGKNTSKNAPNFWSMVCHQRPSGYSYFCCRFADNLFPYFYPSDENS